jgi:hypothetical protein
MVGVEGKDWEDVVLQTSSTFGSLSRRGERDGVGKKSYGPD